MVCFRFEAEIWRHRRATNNMLFDRDGILRQKVIGFEYTEAIEKGLEAVAIKASMTDSTQTSTPDIRRSIARLQTVTIASSL